VRLRQAMSYLDMATKMSDKHKFPFILCGDFNLTPDSVCNKIGCSLAKKKKKEGKKNAKKRKRKIRKKKEKEKREGKKRKKKKKQSKKKERLRKEKKYEKMGKQID
jgi:endonuclease/exonuclease/phosphatase family metal-dependent hydrolase